MRQLITGAVALSVFVCIASLVAAFQGDKNTFIPPEESGEFGLDGIVKALVYLGLPLGVLGGSICGFLHWKKVIPPKVELALAALAIVLLVLLYLNF